MWTILKNLNFGSPFTSKRSPFCSKLGPLFTIFGSPWDCGTVIGAMLKSLRMHIAQCGSGACLRLVLNKISKNDTIGNQSSTFRFWSTTKARTHLVWDWGEGIRCTQCWQTRRYVAVKAVEPYLKINGKSCICGWWWIHVYDKFHISLIKQQVILSTGTLNSAQLLMLR